MTMSWPASRAATGRPAPRPRRSPTSRPQQLPARSGALAEDDVRDALALRKRDQPLRRPISFHANDGGTETFGQLNILTQRVRIVRLNLARAFLRRFHVDGVPCGAKQ